MTALTDEELKRLKEQADRRWDLLGNDFINYRDDCVLKMPFLLARLEAAEEVAERSKTHGCDDPECGLNASYEALRKAAGK